MDHKSDMKETNTKFLDFPFILEHSNRPTYKVELVLMLFLGVVSGVVSIKMCEVIPDVSFGTTAPQTASYEVHLELIIEPSGFADLSNTSWQYIEYQR